MKNSNKNTLMLITIFLSSLFISNYITLTNSFNLDSQRSVLSKFEKNPKTQAIFATMATQLKSSNNGFDRVIGSLADLESSCKSQSFSNQLTLTKLDQSCQVSQYKLKERQDFFDGNLSSIKDQKEDSDNEHAVTKDLKAQRESQDTKYNKILKEETTLHGDEEKESTSAIKNAQDSLQRVEKCVEIIQKWDVEKEQLNKQEKDDIIKSIKQIGVDYAIVFHIKVDLPIKTLENTLNDDQIKRRLLIWLGGLKLQFLTERERLSNVYQRRIQLSKKIKSKLNDIINDLKLDSKTLGSQIEMYDARNKVLEKKISVFGLMSKKNSELLDEKTKDCDSEKNYYETMIKDGKDSCSLYRSVGIYFKEDYSVMKEYFKNKYSTA